MKRIFQVSIILISLLHFTGCIPNTSTQIQSTAIPEIFPDYTYVTVPSTIAPLNFTPQDTFYTAVIAEFSGTRGNSFRVKGRKNITIPKNKWTELLKANKGDSISVTLKILKEDKWIQHTSFPIYISEHPIDHGLVYRLIAPGYELYSRMGIYQRDLQSYKQKTILVNTLLPETCMNCHSVNRGDPDFFNLHLRGSESGTIILKDGNLEVYDTKTPETLSNCVYPYWHPSGRFIAYSVNTTRQMFPMDPGQRIEVYDTASDIVVYDTEQNHLISSKHLTTEHFETFPAFSPDGKDLYFCVADCKDMPQDYKEVRYALCRISFDSETASFGTKVDTLLHAPGIHKSVTFPRPSYDGNFLTFTLADYGTFPIWHKEADIGIIDLRTGEWRLMEGINSPHVDSYHSWSSNSRWMVFSSRRGDGLYTRLYIAFIDENGNTGKPFLLPQKDPAKYYPETLYSFNIPEFITSPVDLDMRKIAKKTARKTSMQWGGLKDNVPFNVPSGI